MLGGHAGGSAGGSWDTLLTFAPLTKQIMESRTGQTVEELTFKPEQGRDNLILHFKKNRGRIKPFD